MKNEIQVVDTEWGKVAIYTNGDCISATIGGGTFWDGPLLLPFYEKWSGPEKVAIEIGAFSGIGALFLSKRNERVIAVEPLNFALLQRTVTENELRNVLCLKGAAYSDGGWFLPGDQEGKPAPELVAAEEDNPGGVGVVRVGGDWAKGAECIQGFKVDGWVEDFEQVGLIKSDAQGCDLRALVGLRKTIERCRPGILFEFEEDLSMRHGDGWGDYERFFEELGYELEEQTASGYANNWIATPGGKK